MQRTIIYKKRGRKQVSCKILAKNKRRREFMQKKMSFGNRAIDCAVAWKTEFEG